MKILKKEADSEFFSFWEFAFLMFPFALILSVSLAILGGSIGQSKSKEEEFRKNCGLKHGQVMYLVKEYQKKNRTRHHLVRHCQIKSN